LVEDFQGRHGHRDFPAGQFGQAARRATDSDIEELEQRIGHRRRKRGGHG
jgi:hypothetical protein